MTHTEWIITCLSLHTLLTVVSSGQEGAKGLSTLLSPSSRGQIKGLSPAFQISVFFLPQCTLVQKFSVASFVCVYLCKYYIYLHAHTHTYRNSIYIGTSVVICICHVCNWCCREHCHTTARDSSTAAASQLLVKSASPLPRSLWHKIIKRRQRSVDFSEMTLSPFHWSLCSTWATGSTKLLRNGACRLHPKVFHAHWSVIGS